MNGSNNIIGLNSITAYAEILKIKINTIGLHSNEILSRIVVIGHNKQIDWLI